ncbi:MAG: vWA domain-containing protein [Bacilli bacterium]
MKNKNGFTLIEIIISLVLLVAVGLLITTNLNKTFTKFNEDEYDNFVSKVNSATNIYLDNNSRIKNELETSKAFVFITVNDLIETGLLDQNILKSDILEENDINENTKIKVSFDANGLYLIEFKPTIEKDSYLIANQLIISDEDNLFNNKTYCNNYVSDPNKLEGFAFVDVNGAKINVVNSEHPEYVGNIKTVNCDNIKNIPGSYEMVYTYRTPDSKIEKTYKRNVIVYSKILETTKVNPELYSDDDTKDYFVYNEVINYKLTIKNESSVQRTINIKDLLIKASIDVGDLTYPNNVNATILSNAKKFFSIAGLTLTIGPKKEIIYEFPLVVLANAGTSLKYKTNYIINDKAKAETSTSEKKVEKSINLSAITEHGANIILVLDTSNSMSSKNRLGNLKTAANLFIDQQNLISSEICIEKFASSASLLGCSKDKAKLQKYIRSLSTGGGTAYKKALSKATDIFEHNFIDKINNKKYIIFISDGYPGDSNSDINNTANNLKNNKVIIYTISVDMGSNAILENMASQPSEKYYFQSESAGLSEVFANISQSINFTGNKATEDGFLSISDIDPNEKIKFTINDDQIIEYNNVAAAEKAGYIINKNKINIKKFPANSQISFSYYVKQN